MTVAATVPAMSRQVSSPLYCFFESLIRPAKSFGILVAGREFCNPDYQVERDSFPCFGLEFVASGKGELLIDGHSYPLRAGTLFCYGPGIPHRIHANPAQPMVKYFVDFFGRSAAKLLAGSGIAPGRAIQVLEVESFRNLFELLIAQGSQNHPHTPRICAGYIEILALKSAEGFIPAAPNLSALEENFHRWRDFIDANFTRLRDLGEIAAELHVSAPHLCKVFKQFGQPGPFQYLTRRKISLAAELLVAGKLSVKAAAMEVGYADPYHFSRLFKAHFGHAPKHFVELSARS